jgi:RNA polymerase sigma factor (sigma-70 family)
MAMEALELVDRLRSSPEDRNAQEQLYLLLREDLLERLEAKIPARARPRLEAEDVLHAAFVKALEGLQGFQPRPGTSFQAWVYRIARNLILDCTRRRSAAALRLVRGDSVGGPRESAIPQREGGEEQALQRREWIEGILRLLRPPEAQVIRLRWLEGRSFEEIAAALGKSVEAVRKFHARSWSRFREIARSRNA